MKKFKAKKQKTHSVRLPENIFPRIQELRQLMEKTAHVGRLKLNPEVELRDSVVLSFAVALASMAMSGHSAIIDRGKFLRDLDREVVRRMPEFAKRSEDERRAMLDLLFAGSCEFSAYNLDSPIKAAATGTGQPS